ncbi:MAG: cupredoxin domain-containing protein [Nitrosopumilus sp.]
MNQNSKKKTGMISSFAMMGMILTLALFSGGGLFDQVAAIENNNDIHLSQEESSSLPDSTDNTIRLTGGIPDFVPNFIQVNVGEKITFVNVDGTNGGTSHAVISVNSETGVPDGLFDSGLLKTGDRFEVQFDESRVYTYVDSMYHPQIHGIISVVE